MRPLAVLLAIVSSAVFAQDAQWTVDLDSPATALTLWPDAETPAGVVFGAGPEVYLVNGGGSVGWRTDVGATVIMPPTVADLDASGGSEIIVATRNGVIALDANGDQKFEWKLDVRGSGYKTIAAADVHPSRGLELIVGFNDGWLRCLSAKGELLWQFYGDKFRVGPPASGDVDNDGETEIVYGTDNGHVYCLNGFGKVEWRYDEFAPYGRSGPNLADLDGDGSVEVLITRSNVNDAPCLMALDGATGAFKWRTDDIMQGYVSNAIADFDQDGTFEVIHADKGNFVYCENADGSRRWQVTFNARGIFFAPAIADVDGDGRLEVLIGARDHDPEDGTNLYVIEDDGTVAHRLALGRNMNTSPAVGDINDDGVLDVIVNVSNPNQIQCLSFGGAGRVAWPSRRGGSANTGTGPAVATGGPTEERLFQEKSYISWSNRSPYLGNEEQRFTWSMPYEKALFAEVATEDSDGFRRIAIRELAEEPGEASFNVVWPFYGPAMLSMRIFAMGMDNRPIVGAARRWDTNVGILRTVGERELTLDFENAYLSAHQLFRESKLLRQLWDRAENEGEFLNSNAKQIPLASLIAGVEDYKSIVHHTTAVAWFLQEFLQSGRSDSFYAWQDTNPWDRFNPQQIPSEINDSAVNISAFQNESESIALSILNLSADPMDIRATFAKPGLTGLGPISAPPALADHITLRRAVPVAGRDTDVVWDALPEMDRSQSITIPPGEVRQIWLIIDTEELEPGAHELPLYLGELAAQTPVIQEAPVTINVWPVRLPDGGAARMNWSRITLDTPRQALDDMIDHGISVVYGPNPPAIEVDAQGNVVNEGDWTEFDATLSRLPDYFQVYFHDPPQRAWPDGAAPEEKSELYNAGFRAGVRVLARHMQEIGWGYGRWAFYPIDEPFNTGFTLVPQLRWFCEQVKAADPQTRTYTDPTGGVRVEWVEPFKDIIDVWQPEINILKRQPELVEWMQANANEFLAYEATDPGKDLLPLGYYRALGWFAAHFQLDGYGWWVYKYGDLWWPHDSGEWSVVYPNGEEVVPSRRWEAARDGLEDFKMLNLFREVIDQAQGDEKERLQALLDEALHEIATWQIGVIDEITRRTRDYEIDFEKLRHYRNEIATELIALHAN